MERRVRELIRSHQEDKNLTDEIIEPWWNWYKADLRNFTIKNKMLSTYDNQANFKNTKLNGYHFEESHLEYADFENAGFLRAHFEETHLMGANLKKAKLRVTHLERADLICVY